MTRPRKLTLLANVTLDRTPAPPRASVWMFCKGQRDTSQAVTPIAKLVPQNRSLLIPRPRHPAAGLRPLPNVCLQPSPLQSTTEAKCRTTALIKIWAKNKKKTC